MTRELGPHVKKLIAARMSILMIPPGSPNPLATGLEALQSPQLKDYARNAKDWVLQAVDVVKTSPDNPFGDDDEAIAQHLLAMIEKRRKRMIEKRRKR